MKNNNKKEKEYFVHLEKQIHSQQWLAKSRNINILLNGKNLFLFFSKHRTFSFVNIYITKIMAKPRGEKCVNFSAETYLYIYIKDAILINHCLFAFPHVNFFSLAFHIQELP